MISTPSWWAHIRWFKPSEFACRCTCNRCEMDYEFVRKLDQLREDLQVPLAVSSGFRCPDHNARVSSTGATGPHVTGHAVDLLLSGFPVYRLLGLAREHGFHGIGLKQHGAMSGRFVHLDDLQGPPWPRPTIWTYP